MQSYSTGTVTSITQETEIPQNSQTGYMQGVVVHDKQGNQDRTILVGSPESPLSAAQRYKPQEQVVLVAQPDAQGQLQYAISDQYRLPGMAWLLVGFFAIVLVVSRLKGLSSLLGMIASLALILYYMVPQISAGTNPVLVSILAAGAISAIIIYFGHGWNYRSHIALACMLVSLAFVGVLSHVVIQALALAGVGDETASYLQFSGIGAVNLQGLFLGGIILAALSVLDDSVISQVSVLYQLKEVRDDISFGELWRRGMAVGRDHISTLVNTLILAYAGSSLPLLILFSLNSSQPAWVSLNDQMIAEEVVRTLTGSIGLVFSIPLTTLVAAYVISRRSPRNAQAKPGKKSI